MNDEQITYGLIGCGSFGRFCLREYLKIPELRCIAVADRDAALAAETAAQFELESCTPEALLALPDIALIHLATPPSTHAALAMAALEAGKNVLCEKPLALNLDDAHAMAQSARKRQRILAVNLIMRYNPLCAAVKRLCETGLLGCPLYATLVNAAQDETLPPEHWFWDPSRSGGIFIEHGVHFFDLFEWWFGPGEVLSAQALKRAGTGIIDQVQCSVLYGAGTLGTFYHGFHQLLRRDAQAWRILFEMGTLTMNEWVPTICEIDLHGTEAAVSALEEMFPGCTVEILDRYHGPESQAISRGRPRKVDLHARLRADAGLPKPELYRVMPRRLMADQLATIRDASHARIVSEENGVTSLAYATAAQQSANRGGIR